MTQSLAYKKAVFSSLLQSNMVIVDTCFIFHPGFESFMEYFASEIRCNPILLLDTVYYEMIKKETDPRLQSLVAKRKVLLHHLVSDGMLKRCKDAGKQTRHVDQVLLRIVQQYSPNADICVLSNDRALRYDIYNIQNPDEQTFGQHLISVVGFVNKKVTCNDITCNNGYKLIYWGQEESRVRATLKLPKKPQSLC